MFDDADSENVDPASFSSPSKKSRNDDNEKPFKPFTFGLAPSKSMPPPPSIPSRLKTPIKANMSSPRAPLTAPAGRSPKRKTLGISKSRRTSAPFSRIDPPFTSGTSSSLPFSLDAALSGTFTKSVPKDVGATIQETMPKNWFFDIYEDTPEEEAANLMEHSTLTLDLSSDEEGGRKLQDDRGKENMPPEDYDAPPASRPVAENATTSPRRVKKVDIIRKKIVKADEMDDDQRAPLCDLETGSFIPEGLDKLSHVVVDQLVEQSTTTSKHDEHQLFATAVPSTAGSGHKSSKAILSKALLDMPIVTADGDLKGDIVVWEDSPTSMPDSPCLLKDRDGATDSAKTFVDENSAPTNEVV